MAELTTQERLQPSLLDRLTDNEPDQTHESRERRVLSLPRLREAVLRDLAWLLNTTHLAVSQDLSAYPEVAKSVLNFGLPELTGTSLAGLDSADLERQVRECVANFEPRLGRQSLEVRVTQAPEEDHQRSLKFEIIGELLAKPIPVQLFLKTEVDLENGLVDIVDAH
jgi:type VI secretion system protein ImpF